MSSWEDWKMSLTPLSFDFWEYLLDGWNWYSCLCVLVNSRQKSKKGCSRSFLLGLSDQEEAEQSWRTPGWATQTAGWHSDLRCQRSASNRCLVFRNGLSKLSKQHDCIVRRWTKWASKDNAFRHLWYQQLQEENKCHVESQLKGASFSLSVWILSLIQFTLAGVVTSAKPANWQNQYLYISR